MKKAKSVRLEWAKEPWIAPCAIGEPADYRGLKFFAVYPDKSKELIDVTMKMFHESNVQGTADRFAHIVYDKKKLTVAIPLRDVYLCGIKSVPKCLLNYFEGDMFNRSDVSVIAYYSDGSSREISNYKTFPYQALTLDDTSITFKYGRYTCNLPISVVASWEELLERSHLNKNVSGNLSGVDKERGLQATGDRETDKSLRQKVAKPADSVGREAAGSLASIPSEDCGSRDFAEVDMGSVQVAGSSNEREDVPAKFQSSVGREKGVSADTDVLSKETVALTVASPQSPIGQILQFVLSLQDEYGFMVDISRLKTCFSSVNDISDLDEVVYRIQSLVCSSEDEVGAFRSLFAQRFFGKSIGEMAQQKIKALKQSRELKDQLAKKKKDCDAIEKELAEINSEKTGFVGQANQISKELDDLNRRLNEINDVLHAPGSFSLENSPNPRVRIRFRRLKNSLAQLCRFGIDGFHDISDILMNGSDVERYVLDQCKSLDGMNNLEVFEKRVFSILCDVDSPARVAALELYNDLDLIVCGFIDLWRLEIGETGIRSWNEMLSDKRELLEEIKERQEVLTKLTDRIRKLDESIQKFETKMSRKKHEIAKLDGAIRPMEVVVKESSVLHRDVFAAGNNRAVQTTAEMEQVLDISLKAMNAQQQAAVLSFIRTNARIFRQTLRRKSAVPVRREVDIRKTMRMAARTDGEPMQICYKSPKKNRAKVVCLVDISGSCRAAAELSLYFMAMMDAAFPGGCKKFAFVNKLVSVDKYFENQSPTDGVLTVGANVPSRGVYSNYGRTIHELRQQYEPLFHKDTTVIIFGDARNNRNASSEKDLKFIADRARKVFWLNPDDTPMWGRGDSIIYDYERAGAKLFHVSTAGELLHFLTAANSMV